MAAKKDDQKFMANLLHFVLDQRETPQEVDEDLKRMGLNPAPLCERVRQLVDAKREEARLDWIEQATTERKQFEATVRTAPSLESLSREELMDRINELLGPAKVYYRNFQDMTDEDLRSQIEDLEMLGDDDEAGEI